MKTDSQTLRAFLAKSRVFQGLNEIEIATLVGLGMVETYEDRDIILKQGSSGDSYYVVLRGSIVISKDKGSENVAIAELQPGDVFGEVALAQKRPRTATATVAEDQEATVLRFTFPDFEKMQQYSPEAAKKIMDNMKKIIGERSWSL